MLSQSKLICLFLVLLIQFNNIQPTLQTRSKQDNQQICTEIKSLQKKLEEKREAIKKADMEKVQLTLDTYKKSRQYMNEAFDIMSPKVFLQYKLSGKQIKQKNNAIKQTLNQLKESSASCQDFYAFQNKKYKQTCEKLIMIQSQSSKKADYCELAKTEGNLLKNRKIKSTYLKDTVCHSVYIIELLDALITDFEKIKDGSRKYEIDEALAKVKLSRENAKCDVEVKKNQKCQHHQYVTGEYKAYEGHVISGQNIKIMSNTTLEKCKKECDNHMECYSIDFDTSTNNRCWLNKVSREQAKAINKYLTNFSGRRTLYDKVMGSKC